MGNSCSCENDAADTPNVQVVAQLVAERDSLRSELDEVTRVLVELHDTHQAWEPGASEPLWQTIASRDLETEKLERENARQSAELRRAIDELSLSPAVETVDPSESDRCVLRVPDTPSAQPRGAEASERISLIHEHISSIHERIRDLNEVELEPATEPKLTCSPPAAGDLVGDHLDLVGV